MEIKKDFLDKEYLKELKKPIYEGTMGFFFNNTVAGVGDKRITDCFFTHVLYSANKPNSNLFQLYVPLLEKLKVKSLIRMKLMCIQEQKNYITTQVIQIFHTNTLVVFFH